MPRRSCEISSGAMPLIRPMAYKHWGKARTEGLALCQIPGSPAGRSLAANQAAEPMQMNLGQSRVGVFKHDDPVHKFDAWSLSGEEVKRSPETIHPIL